MTTTLTRKDRITGSLQGLGASWWSVGLFAVVLAFANGFIVTSMQWTIGAIERLKPPFEQWMFNSVVMIPVYAGAIIGALYLARRLAGEGSGKAKKLWIAVATIIVAGTLVAMANMALSSLYDYYLQTTHIDLGQHLRHPLYRVDGTTPVLVGSSTCDATCQAINATRSTHIRGFFLAAKLFLVIDAVLVLWTLALRGGVVWVPRRARRAQVETSSVVAGTPAMAAG
jgi:hypothetical protein